MSERTETIEGYVVDTACIRKYPGPELLERARAHTRACALMGHCIESGYSLVSDNGRVTVLDTEATPLVVTALQNSDKGQGIKLRATRKMQKNEMETSHIEEI